MSARARPRAGSRPAAAGGSAPPPATRPGTGRPLAVRLVRHHPVALALGFAAIHLALAWLTLQPAPHTGGDNAAYITLARSLLERGSFLSLWDPAAPLHTQYPPGFPLLLAAALMLGVQPWVGLKLVIALVSAVAVAFTFLWLRRRNRPGLALGVTAVMAVAPGVLEQAHWVLSDVPFWAFTMLALWAFERLPPAARGRVAVAVLATLAAYFTRSAGLPLVVAAVGWLVLRRRWRELAVLGAVVGIPAFLWWLRAQGAGGVDYVSQFWLVNPYEPHLGRMGLVEFAARMLQNGHKYLTLHLPILLSLRTGTLFTVMGVGIVACALLGWAARLRRPTVAEFFLPLYVGLLLVWPQVWSGERFLLPALPLLLAYGGEGLLAAVRRLHPAAAMPAAAGAAALLILLALPGLRLAARAGMACTAEWQAGDRWACLPLEWRDFIGLAEWARDGLPADAVVLSRKPRLFHLLSGRPGDVYPFTPYADDLFAAAERTGAAYVVLDRVDAMGDIYLTPAILERTSAFCILQSTGAAGTAILGILPGAAADAPAAEAGVVSFEVCNAGYFASPEARERALDSF